MNRPSEQQALFFNLAQAQDIIILFDSAWNVTFINPAITTWLGYTPEEFIQNPYIAHDPDSEIKFKAIIQQALKEQVTHVTDLVSRHTHKNQKEVFWFQSNISFTYASGVFRQALLIARNIPPNKRTEKQLQLLEEELNHVQELGKVGSWEMDMDTQKQTWSQAQCRLFELEPDQTPDTFEEFLHYVHPEDRHLLIESRNKMKLVPGQYQNLNPIFRIITPRTNTIKYLNTNVKGVFKDNKLVRIRGINQDITETIIREETLKATCQNLVDSQELADLGSWQYDMEADTLVWSKGECKIYEVPPSEAPARLKEFLTFIHPEDQQIFLAYLQLLRQSAPDRFSREVRIYTRTGKMKYIRWVIKPELDNGKTSRIKGITQDITRQKEYENQIRKTHEQFRLLFHAMIQGVLILNESCVIMNANPALETIAGIPVAHLMGMSLGTFLLQCQTMTEDGKPLQVEACKAKILEGPGGRENGLTCTIFNPILNEHRWVVVRAIKVADSPSGNIATYVTVEDVTAHRKSFELLRQSEQRFSDGFKYSALGMTMSRADGRLVEVNEAACQIFGYTREELLKLDLIKLTHPDDVRATQKHIRSLLQGKADSFQLEKRYIRKDKTIIWAILTVSVIKSGEGKPHALIGQIQDITRLRETEKSLQETDRVFRLAQDYAKIGSWHWRIKYGTLSWSDTVFRIFGLNPKTDRVSYSRFLQLIHPQDRDRVEQAVENALSKGTRYEVEHRVLLKSGEIRWVLEKGNVVRGSHGEPTEMYGIVRDVTEAKKISEELKASRKLYKLLAESGQDVIALHAEDGQIEYVSPSVQALLGYKPKELVGRITPWDLVDEKDTHTITALFETARKSKHKAHNITIQLRHKRGHFIWCATSLMAVESPDKKTTSFRSLTWNVQQQILTDQKLKLTNAELTNSIARYREVNRKLELTLEELSRKTMELLKANQELTKSKGKLARAHEQLELKSSALNQMAIVVMSDSMGRIMEVNPRFLKITGYKKSEVIGKSHCIRMDSMFNSGTHPKAFFDQIWECLKQGEVWQGEICNRSKSGSLFWLFKTVVPLINKAGKLEGFFSFSNDITDQKRRESELMQAKRLAEEASAIKEDFLSVMSHEIRTPLNAVIGLSNLLMKKNPKEEQLPILETLKTASDSLLHLVNDILDYNKIKTKKIELENTAFSIMDMVRQLTTTYQHMAQEKGLQFRILSSPDLPVAVKGDLNRLYQILNNLLNNAIKFTQKGHVILHVKSEPINTRTIRLMFRIEDTGIGIHPDQLPLLFLPFHQAERNIARKFGGTGLGLSIVKGLIDLFKGEIQITSELGKGTTLTLWVPLTRTRPTALTRTEVQVTDDLRTLDVLYVEDVESNQLLVKNILEEYKVNCVVTSNGNDALIQTQQKEFQVILMDLQLPGMNGYEVTKQLRGQSGGKNLHTPVIAFTAEPYSEELKVRTESVGIHSIMTKPFKYESLIERIFEVAKGQTPACRMGFYEDALMGNLEKILEVKTIIKKDLKRFVTRFFRAIKQGNNQEMSAEIHKMLPILKNLKAQELLQALQPFRQPIKDKTFRQQDCLRVRTACERLIEEVNAYKGPVNSK